MTTAEALLASAQADHAAKWDEISKEARYCMAYITRGLEIPEHKIKHYKDLHLQAFRLMELVNERAKAVPR